MVLVSYKLLNKHELYKLMIQVFGLAVVRRLLHAGLGHILPMRGELHDHGGVYRSSGQAAKRATITCNSQVRLTPTARQMPRSEMRSRSRCSTMERRSSEMR